MATVQKRGNSYRLRSSCGYTPEGKQVMKSKTWTPTPGMTERQIEKELTRQMVLFDEECRGSSLTDGHIKFETFARQWFTEYVEKALGKRTQANYKQLAPRVYQSIGHLYMDKVTPRQVQKFVNILSEPGANQTHPDRGLSPKSIKNHLSFISAVFTYAIKMGMIQNNPCRAVTLPTLETGKEKVCYTLEEAQAFLDALTDAPIRWQVFFSLALFGGFRREELCGFEFEDFDMEQHTVSVCRASLYTPKDGIITAPTKTTKSRRTLKLPAWIFDLVKQLRAEQTLHRLALGDQWQECGRLFTKLDGSPIGLQQPYQWLQKFCEEKGLPFYGVHQFRYLNASLLIFNGEDVRSVSAALGHSQTTTTVLATDGEKSTLRTLCAGGCLMITVIYKCTYNVLTFLDFRLYYWLEGVDNMDSVNVTASPKTATFQMRINPEVKQRVEAIYARQGLTFTDAVNIFIQQSLNMEGLPFLVSPENEAYMKAKAMRRLMTEVKKGWDSAEENGWISEEDAYRFLEVSE